jgi:hypothetical protein
MRTTITLDDDVAALLARVRREHSLGLKKAVNEALRRGLPAVGKPGRGKPFRTQPLDTGRLLFPVDDVAAALEHAEGPDHR